MSRAGRSMFWFGFWVLAVYYFVAGRRPEFRPLYQVTVYTRASALPLTAAMVLLLRANPLIILFTAGALGALWTALALRADRRA
jgi:hypothetical protein